MTDPTGTIRSALAACPPDCDRETWLRLGMAVHAELPNAEGSQIFDAWSQGAESYKARDVRDVWRSFKPGRVTVGTLFAEAKRHGWRPDPAQAPTAAPTAAELKARAEGRRAAAEREERERAERQRAAAIEAATLWEGAADVHEPSAAPYLVRKGVQGLGVRRLIDGTLCLPLRTASGELVNVQRIAPERPRDGAPEKRFVKGALKSGAFHALGDPEGAAWLLIAEGYATAASCHEATGRPAIVAFDAGNLAHVVRAVRGRWPAARLLICGDDDRATAERTGRNPGREKATEAARLARGAAVFPEGLSAVGSDFNDLHLSAGLDAVRELIERAIVAAGSAAAPGRGEGSGDAAKAAPTGRQRPARGNGDGGNDDDTERGEAGPRDRFRVDDVGLWFDPPGDDGGEARPVRICAPLHVTGLARDAHDAGAALLLEFDAFGKARRWLMPLETLAGDGTAYRAALLSQGFVTPTDAKRRALLTSYLQSRRPDDLVRTVDRVGWHGRAYVLPRETLGDDGGERVIFTSDAPIEATFGRRGSLDQWKERIAAPCAGNSRLVFALACAFAGPLLAWAPGTGSGGFHLVGDSSCGKTTALACSASVWGGPSFLQRWRATDNGLEALAAQHSDCVLLLDELKQLDGRVAGESAYLLANGAGKIRAARTGAARPRLTWRLVFLSSGEAGLADYMAESGRRTNAGQELRMVDLPADAGAGRGIFEHLHGHEGGGDLARHLARACETTYGTAGRGWLEWLTSHTDGLAAAVRERVDAIEVLLVPELASGQVQRVARRFALVGVAGEMATEAGITGWPAGEAINGVRRCFNAWIESRPGGIGMSETAQMLRQVRGWFGLHGDARFVDWDRSDDSHAPKVMNRAGWRKPVKTTTGLEELIGWEWFILPDVFRSEICKGFRDRAALRLLDELGHLHRESTKGYGCRACPPGAQKVNVYRIKSSILAEADE